MCAEDLPVLVNKRRGKRDFVFKGLITVIEPEAGSLTACHGKVLLKSHYFECGAKQVVNAALWRKASQQKCVMQGKKSLLERQEKGCSRQGEVHQ